MASEKKSAHIAGIIDMMSYANICGAVVDNSGKILGVTPRFAKISGNGKANQNLSDIFEELPDMSSLRANGEFKLTFKSSGEEVGGKVISTPKDNGSFAVIFRDFPERDTRSVPESAHTVYASDDLIFQFDVNAKVYYVSINSEKITGYSNKDFLSGRIHPLDIVHPEDKLRLQREFKDIFVDHKSVENSVHRIVKKNGEIAYLLKSWYPLLDTEGRFSGVIGLNKDITKEKILERRLQLFQSAFQHSTDAIVITGIDGRIIDVNDAFTKIYGYPRDEVIGKSTALVQSKHSTPDFYKQMWDSLEKNDQWKGEIINRRKDGSEIPIWLSITPIYLDGTKIGYMGIESDISERKNLEQQIIQTEKLATIGQLSAGIAHEIGTPLNIISGNAEFILLDMNESDKGYQELSTIIDQTRRMTLLMRQLLDFARPKILSLQAVNVNDVIREVLGFVRPQFKKNNIEIKTQLGDDIPRVYGDPALLYQVFLNIVVNSFQAMARGGELRVQTGTDGESTGRRRIIVKIKDTGEGIQPEHIEKLFTPFFTTKEPGKGTGLGLAVTRRIVQEHNGAIEIESELGKGTVVTIQFNAFEPHVRTESKQRS